MDYYTELKRKVDIYQIASELGFNGKQSGRYSQGDCPRHNSKNKKCLTITPHMHMFKCFHCGEGGDVINLVQLYKRCDHITAVNYLADKVGMPHITSRNLTHEEQEKKRVEYEENILVENILTEATYWYHDQLKKYSDIFDHLRNHYGFSDEIINDQMIGFAPVANSEDSASELAQHLNTFPEFKGKIHKSGLFNFNRPGGHYYDFFKGRIIFPYWKNGKVVYMAARKTDLTPDDGYEDATYKKLRRHDANDDKNKYISEFVQNNTFIGEDTIRGKNEIIITEGIPDAISAIDHEFPVISPATTTFREQDHKKLEMLTRSADSIYIINDNEKNKAGKEGALKTGKYLTKKGKNVFLVELPRLEGIEKIDLNEYFIDHSAEDLLKLIDNSKSVLEIMIEELPDNFLRAEPIMKRELAPILIELDSGILNHYVDMIKKKVNTNTKTIISILAVTRKAKYLKEQKPKEIKIDPEIEERAQVIAQDQMLLKRRIDLVNQSGVVGERKNIAMNMAALDSRLLPEDVASPNVLAIKNAGHYGSGKSYALLKCLIIYPESAYYLIVNGSAKSLYYLENGLKHKALVVMEGFQFQTNHADDSEFVYCVRSLISEGRINYPSVEKGEDGKHVTVDKKIDGPTSFITTTIVESLEPQLEDRLFTIHPDESAEQTSSIIILTANQAAGITASLDEKTILSWKRFHELLKPVDIIIPYAPKIAEFIIQNKKIPLATRRAFKRVLSLIKTIACCYQYQRKKDSDGSIISETCDYWMGYQIVRDSFKESMGQESEATNKRISFIKENGPVRNKDIAKEQGVSSSAISSWVKNGVKEGLLIWCDEKGKQFDDDRELKKSKSSGKAFVTVSDSYEKSDSLGIPTPYELTKDPEWGEGGRLFKQYDLELNRRGIPDSRCKGVNAVLIPTLNTSNDNQPIDNIPVFDDKNEGVKVFSSYLEGINNPSYNETDYELPIMEEVIINDDLYSDSNGEHDDCFDNDTEEEVEEDQKETGIVLF